MVPFEKKMLQVNYHENHVVVDTYTLNQIMSSMFIVLHQISFSLLHYATILIFKIFEPICQLLLNLKHFFLLRVIFHISTVLFDIMTSLYVLWWNLAHCIDSSLWARHCPCPWRAHCSIVYILSCITLPCKDISVCTRVTERRKLLPSFPSLLRQTAKRLLPNGSFWATVKVEF